MKRVGLFGGTFNPIHFGHLRAAEEARELLLLDRVELVIASLPPHKPSNESLAAVTDRVRMVELAIAGNPGFKLNRSEIERPGRSYSVETIAAYRDANPDNELYFLLGADAFGEIHTWREFPRIFASCNVAVLARPNCQVRRPPVAIEGEFCYDSCGKRYVHSSGYSLTFVSITQLEISASRVREWIANGQSIRYLVPSRVEEYVRQRGLYRGRLTN